VAVPPRLGGLVAVTAACIGAYIGLSVLFAPRGVIAYNFASEQGTVTTLSTGMLLMAACLAAMGFWSVREDSSRARLLWAALTVVMSYFAVDEVMEFHERVGEFLNAHVPRGPFRNWNDIVVILYGIAVIPLALLLWHEVLRYRRLFTMLVVTGLLYVGTTSVDTLTTTPTDLSNIVEEGLKGTCSTFFMLSMLTGLVAARSLQLVRTGQEPSGSRILRREAATMQAGVLVGMAGAGLTFLLPAGGHERDVMSWAGALCGVALVLRGAVRATRSRTDPASEYADFWADRTQPAPPPPGSAPPAV